MDKRKTTRQEDAPLGAPPQPQDDQHGEHPHEEQHQEQHEDQQHDDEEQHEEKGQQRQPRRQQEEPQENPQDDEDEETIAQRKQREARKAELMKSELDELKKIDGTPEELDIICTVFNRNIMGMIRFIMSKEDSPDIHALNTAVREVINESATLALDRCKDKIWGAREYIKNENSDYFLKRDYSNLIKKDKREGFITSIVSIIKDGWNTLYDEERDQVWAKTKLMLKCVAIYEKWRRASQ